MSISFGGRWHWLAPVMGCFLLLLVVLNPRDHEISDWAATNTPRQFATISSNQHLAAYLGGHSLQNGLSRERLEWTNVPQSVSAINALPAPTTTNLLR